MAKDDLEINITSIKKKTKKTWDKVKKIDFNKSLIVAFILIIVLMTMAFQIRAQTSDLPMIRDSAHSQVENQYIQMIGQQVQQQNPAMSEADLNREIEGAYQEFYRENREMIDNEKEQAYTQLKNYFTDDRYDHTYLVGIDPYHYWRYTQNYLEKGHITESVSEDGKYVDELMLAPLGRESERQTLHPIYSAWTYKFMNFFSDVSPYWVFFMMPVLVGMLTIIPAFFIGRKFGGNVAGIISGLVMAVHPSFVGRSIGGFSSTDSYNLLFPLLIFWLAIEAFDTKNNWLRLTYGALAGLIMGVFSRTWGAWSSIYVMIFIILAGYLLFSAIKYYLKKDKNQISSLKKAGVITGSFFLSSALFVSLFTSFSSYVNVFYSGLIRRLGLQETIGTGLWPNVMTTVAELNRPSVSDIISTMGGEVLFFMAIMGVCLTLVPLKDLRKEDYYYLLGSAVLAFLALTTFPGALGSALGISEGIMFTLFAALPVLIGLALKLFDDRSFNIAFAMFAAGWFIAMVFTSSQGVRFMLLLVPAFAVALSVFLGRAVLLLEAYFKKEKSKVLASQVIILVVGIFLLSGLVEDGYASGYGRVPGMNDAWFNAQDTIRLESDEDAIITSWWDFGHWFKEVAERRVTFDGASQNTPMAHWTGRLLLTSDENEAVAILRMLDCGGREGFNHIIESMTGEDVDNASPEEFFLAKQVLDEALALEDNVLSHYEEHMSSEDAEKAVELTHCTPPQGLLITSEDMVGKSSVWGHFGGWSFERAYIISDLRDRDVNEAVPMIQDLLGLDEESAREVYFEARNVRGQRATNEWISIYPNYLTNQALSCEEEDDGYLCRAGLGLSRQGGVITELTGVVINPDEPSESRILITARDENTGANYGRETLVPSSVIVNGEKFETGGSEWSVNLMEDDGEWRAVIGDEVLVDSVFTELYFWEGANTDRFELFHHEQSSMTGNNILIWDVKW